MPAPQPTAAEVLIAKAHFSQDAAERFVGTLTDADLATILEIDRLPNANEHLSSFLNLLVAKQLTSVADEQQRSLAEQGLASAKAEFTAGLKVAKAANKQPIAVPVRAVPSTPAVVLLSDETPKSKKT